VRCLKRHLFIKKTHTSYAQNAFVGLQSICESHILFMTIISIIWQPIVYISKIFIIDNSIIEHIFLSYCM